MDSRRQAGFTLIELMVVVAIIGILAAIAVPNFIKFQGRSRQSEAKANLKAMFTAEKAYFQANNTYSPYINVIGFTPERGNRYCYSLGGGQWQDRTTQIASSDPSETGIEIDTFRWGSVGLIPVQPAVFAATVIQGSAGSFYGTASGNVDLDTTLDQWSISDQQRPQGTPSSTTTCAMDNNPGGEPCNDWTDI